MIGLMSVSEILRLDSCDAFDLDCDSLAEVLDVKRRDDGYRRLLEDVRARGITVPVVIVDGEVREGHHRIAAAIDAGLQVVPWSDIELCIANTY